MTFIEIPAEVPNDGKKYAVPNQYTRHWRNRSDPAPQEKKCRQSEQRLPNDKGVIRMDIRNKSEFPKDHAPPVPAHWITILRISTHVKNDAVQKRFVVPYQKW